MKTSNQMKVRIGYRYEGILPKRCHSVEVKGKSVKNVLDEILPDLSPAEPTLIKAQTGTGKTTACIEILIPFVRERGKNILFVLNRTSVKEEIKYKYLKVIHNDDLKKFTSFGLEEKIVFGDVGFINYQKLSSFLYNPEYKAWRENLGVVVFDEAHFFTADSLFNEDCERILKYATTSFCKAIRIYLTATDGDVLHPLVNAEMNNYRSLTPLPLGGRYLNRYVFSENYSRYQLDFFDGISDLLKKIEESGCEKWIVFVSSKEKGKELLESLPNISQYLDADSKNSDEWFSLIKSQKFEKRILVTTSVLDCGANIVDDEVKNIAVFTDNKTNLLQCMGRKRLKTGEKVKLWVCEVSQQHINCRIQEYQSLLRWFERYDKYYEYKASEFKRDVWNAQDNIRKNLFSFSNSEIYPKDTARFYLERQVYMLSQMLAQGNSFKKTVASWLGKELKSNEKWTKLEDFCKSNSLKAIFEEDFNMFRNLIVEAYKETGYKESQPSRNGTMQVNALNSRLAELEVPFKIQKINLEDLSSEKNCWMIFDNK